MSFISDHNTIKFFIKFSISLFYSFAKLFLFFAELLDNAVFILFYRNIHILKFGDIHRTDFGDNRLLVAHLVELADGTADESAEDVALVDILGDDPVAYHHRRSSEMIRDDSRTPLDVGVSDYFSDLPHYIPEYIRVIHRTTLIERSCDSLEPHPRIDILSWELLEGSVLEFVELHEDIIPDFHPVIFIVFDIGIG